MMRRSVPLMPSSGAGARSGDRKGELMALWLAGFAGFCFGAGLTLVVLLVAASRDTTDPSGSVGMNDLLEKEDHRGNDS